MQEWPVYSLQSLGDVQDPDNLLNSVSLNSYTGINHYFSVFLPSSWDLGVLEPAGEELKPGRRLSLWFFTMKAG